MCDLTPFSAIVMAGFTLTEEQFLILVGKLGGESSRRIEAAAEPKVDEIERLQRESPNGAIGPSGSNEPSEEQTLRCSRSWKRMRVPMQASKRTS